MFRCKIGNKLEVPLNTEGGWILIGWFNEESSERKSEH